MGYHGGELTDLVAPLERGVERFAKNAVPDVGRELRRRVRRHTPVSKTTPAQVLSFGLRGAELMRKGRPHGALRDSWQVGETTVLYAGSVFRVPVFTLDPVAPNVEWDTQPHLIVPRKPGGLLTVPTPDGLVFARLVNHPGTRGAHMMATALQELAAEWQRIVARQWRNEARGRRFWRVGE
jgi:hypothetical protein